VLQELFDSLGSALLSSFVKERRQEDLHLEFKTRSLVSPTQTVES
jgi:hypothetical protein